MWTCLTKRQLREGPRPTAEDTLIGSTYIPLSDVIGGDNISGEFPLFKAGVDRLGSQSVNVKVHKTILPDGEATPQSAVEDEESCLEVLVSAVGRSVIL